VGAFALAFAAAVYAWNVDALVACTGSVVFSAWAAYRIAHYLNERPNHARLAIPMFFLAFFALLAVSVVVTAYVAAWLGL